MTFEVLNFYFLLVFVYDGLELLNNSIIVLLRKSKMFENTCYG
jgi:hypothetical protein